MRYTYAYLQKIKILVLLGAIFLSNSCAFDYRPKRPQVAITKIDYTISLTDRDDQGFYQVQPKEVITITAQAAGPDKDNVWWAVVVKALDNREISVIPVSSQGSLIKVDILDWLKRPKPINQQQRLYFTIKDAGSAREYKITCFFAGHQKQIDGVDLVQGAKEFKIKVVGKG